MCSTLRISLVIFSVEYTALGEYNCAAGGWARWIRDVSASGVGTAGIVASRLISATWPERGGEATVITTPTDHSEALIVRGTGYEPNR